PIGYALYDNPILGFGLNSSFAYKGISLNVDLAGGSMYSYVQNLELRYPFQGGHNSPTWMLSDRWHRADVFDNSRDRKSTRLNSTTLCRSGPLVMRSTITPSSVSASIAVSPIRAFR